MILYEATNYGNNIKIIESERQTEKCVFINGNRQNWKSQWSCFFLTWADARVYILGMAKQGVKSAENRLENAKEVLSKIESLTDPS